DVQSPATIDQIERAAGERGWVDLAQEYLLGKDGDRFLRLAQSETIHGVERALRLNAKLRGVLEEYVERLSSEGEIPVRMRDGEPEMIGGLEAWERLAKLQRDLQANDISAFSAANRATLGRLQSLSSGALNVAHAGLVETQRKTAISGGRRIQGMDKLPDVIDVSSVMDAGGADAKKDTSPFGDVSV